MQIDGTDVQTGDVVVFCVSQDVLDEIEIRPHSMSRPWWFHMHGVALVVNRFDVTLDYVSCKIPPCIRGLFGGRTTISAGGVWFRRLPESK